jgi:hypothetical protein
MDMHFVYSLYFNKYLNYSPFLAVMNCAPVNIHVKYFIYLFLCVCMCT